MRHHARREPCESVAGMNRDKYYGAVARNYDRERAHSIRWARELVAVSDFVTEGPVLDIPLGTGRFVDIYKVKDLAFTGVDISGDMLEVALSKHPGIDARPGDIFQIPFPDGTFPTAVCVRLLDWLTPAEMVAAIAELRRVATILIVSLRHGKEEVRVNQTHDWNRFLAQLDGLHIADRRLTEVTADGIEEIFLLRPAEWRDVLQQFVYHGPTPIHEIGRLAAEWFGYIDVLRFRPRAEYWPAARLFTVIKRMAEAHDAGAAPEDRYITDLPPRSTAGPVTLMRHEGKTVVLDGRRRINAWKEQDGLFPVLVLE